jgi:transposase
VKKSKTTTFLLELPLRVDAGQASRLHAHLEVARCFYNAMLGEAKKRLKRVRADPAWQKARVIARSQKQERRKAFSLVRQQYSFSEYALHDYAKATRKGWIADHLDSTMAQTLASRAFQAANKVCLGQAKSVRFRSKGRGIDSVEGKRNDTGMRFLLQTPQEGNRGCLLWGEDRLPAIIDWNDPVVRHGLKQRIKFARLVRRTASSPQARGADSEGKRYFVQLVLEGMAYQKPKNTVGTDTLGLDIGPSSLAIVARQGPVQLKTFCAELKPNTGAKRRLERKMDRQRRANNPANYDEKGRVKKGRRTWKESHQYQATRRRHATQERKLAAHRKSLHGKLVNDLVRVGNHIQIEKTSFKGWQKMYGKSVGFRAPGMFVAHLRRIVAKTGGTLSEVPTYHSKLSQYCHNCKSYVKKPLSQRWHTCPCGLGPVQRDLYSACLLAYLDPTESVPSITQEQWAGVESRLKAVVEVLHQRANEGQSLPRSFGIPGARARRPQSLVPNQQELASLSGRGRQEALGLAQEPPCL